MSTRAATRRKRGTPSTHDDIGSSSSSNSSNNSRGHPSKRSPFGAIYLWRPKQKIFFRSMYLWNSPTKGTDREYYFGTNEIICNVVIKKTSTVSALHAKIRLHNGHALLEVLTKERVLKVCLPSENPKLPSAIARGTERGRVSWEVEDVVAGEEATELEDWSVFAVEGKVFMLRVYGSASYATCVGKNSESGEEDKISYNFGEEGPLEKTFSLVDILKGSDYALSDAGKAAQPPPPPPPLLPSPPLLLEAIAAQSKQESGKRAAEDGMRKETAIIIPETETGTPPLGGQESDVSTTEETTSGEIATTTEEDTGVMTAFAGPTKAMKQEDAAAVTAAVKETAPEEAVIITEEMAVEAAVEKRERQATGREAEDGAEAATEEKKEEIVTEASLPSPPSKKAKRSTPKKNKKKGNTAAPPQGMMLRYAKDGKICDVSSTSEMAKRHRVSQSGMTKLALGEVKVWQKWSFLGVYDPQKGSIVPDLKPIAQ